MENDLLKMIYHHLKNIFCGTDKRNWIWVDFFEDEKIGFEYFKEQIERDEDYEYLKTKSFNEGELDAFAYDIAYDISIKLKRNDFFHQCGQCMLEC